MAAGAGRTWGWVSPTAIWAAAGVALSAVASKFFFKEPLTLLMSGGIALIVGGVLLIELGGAH